MDILPGNLPDTEVFEQTMSRLRLRGEDDYGRGMRGWSR